MKWMQSDGVDAQGNPKWKPASNPPKKVYVAESSYVEWHKGTVGTYEGSSGSGTCSDGLDDQDYEVGSAGTSRGTHYTQKDGSSGSIDITCQQSANCTVTDGTPSSPYSQYPGYQPHYQSEAFMTWSFSVAPTDRGVDISSSLDATYHCSHEDGTTIHTPVLNVMDGAGTMRGDTLGYDPMYPNNAAFFIDYKANVAGQWGDGSEYHWFSSITQISASGAFSGNSVPNFDVRYSDPQDVDHIFIHLIDSSIDGPDAKANYYMHFHKLYEPADWPDDPRLSAQGDGA